MNTTKARVKVWVDTRRYELSHMHRPRGYGYWGFAVHPLLGETRGVREVWVQGTYTAAKAAACRQAATWGYDRVEVLP